MCKAIQVLMKGSVVSTEYTLSGLELRKVFIRFLILKKLGTHL